MFDILETVNLWLATGKQVALATVVETWGSAPRQAGAKMAVTSDMAMIGSVSGGCVETAVVSEMIDSLDDGKPRLLHFGVSDDTAWDVGLACGGKITVYVESLDTAWWQRLAEYENRAFTTITVLSGEQAGAKLLLAETPISSVPLPPDMLDAVTRAAQDMTTTTRTQVEGVDALIEVYRPSPRLIIIGGAHVAMALKQYAHLLGFRVLLIDPRKAFATQERFPDVERISHEYPDKALKSITLDRDTYVAILTHDPKIDDPALQTVLPSQAAYVGVLSSRRTHEKRLERLAGLGVDSALFSRIHTPIGVDISAKSPEEIALSIMAEIIAVKNKGAAS
jgi:xanthine dehydrogenase accessory factor